MKIRPETAQDINAIEQVTIAAFDGKPYSDQTEHLIVNRLREAGAMSLSLVAEIDGKVVGHVAFSVVTINSEDQDWFGLGPVSVLPELQKQGIGSKLIRDGLSAIKAKGAKGCVLEGVLNYYQRFGFKNQPDLVYEGTPDPKYFMALSFYDDVPNGKVEFHKAFYVNVK
jgi:putative acetyltransferase